MLKGISSSITYLLLSQCLQIEGRGELTMMLKVKGNDNAVSPVVSVILLLAITMIFAAIVGAAAFGMLDNDKPRMISFTTERYGDGITIVNTGGDMKDLTGLEVRIEDRDFVPWVGSMDVGSSQIYGSADGITESYTHIVIRGTFYPNSEQVILLDTHA